MKRRITRVRSLYLVREDRRTPLTPEAPSVRIETMKDGTPQTTMEDQVTIKSGESRLVVERGRIARITNAKRADQPAPATPAS